MVKDLTFYTNPQSRGRIVRWMLEEVNAAYTTRVLAYGRELQSPEFLALNPMGKVPVLQHGDTVITECAAICAYLADIFPEAGLVPENRGAYYRWLFFAAGPLESAIFVKKLLEVDVPADKQPMAGFGDYERTIDTLEKALTGRRYVAGKQFSAADVYVGSHVMWGLQFGTIPDRKVFRDYVSHIADRPAHIRASALDDALVAQHKG